MKHPITVLLVHEASLLRNGFQRALEDDAEVSVVGAAWSEAEAVELTRQLFPDVAVIDMSTPGLNGEQVVRRILREAPGTAVLLVGAHSIEGRLRTTLDAGASGYVLKDVRGVGLADAIKRVAAGQRVLGPVVASSAPPPDDDDLNRLMWRERQVLQLIVEGKLNKEIAALLGLDIKTILFYRWRLKRKLGIHRAADLVRYAIRKGLIQAS
jgi:DNA-binding NarL/FixJ family response regulator